jgi:hypothetical protein
MFDLRATNATFRLGLSCLVLVLLGGLAASATHLWQHHEMRDERPGLTLDDLTGAYHGIRSRSPMVVALEDGHPDELPAAERDALLAWLASDRVTEDYDSLALGERAPAEILDRSCLSCHSRDSEDEVAAKRPLEYWDDVKAVAFSRDISPTDAEIVISSAHTHALGMGTVSVLALLLGWLTRWPRGLVGILASGSGLGLLLDLGAWLPAREAAGLVPVLAAAGALWMTSTALLLLLTLADLWLPARERRQNQPGSI